MHDRFIQIAPMMGYTNRHYRYFLRVICKNAWLFTEMLTAQAIVHGNPKKLLAYDPAEHPLTLQLGGSCPQQLGAATQIAADFGYREVNLNVGCPSARVQSGRFGACLMAEPSLVAECVDRMRGAAPIDVSVKTRLGIDHFDSYEFLHHFVNTVSKAGCKIFILHARKAWLKGLSPKENREKPPLDYEKVYQIKRDFPHLHITINGGIQSLEAAKNHLTNVDGVMLGRVACQNPYLFAQVDQMFYGEKMVLSREEILERSLIYLGEECKKGTLPYAVMRHWIGLFYGTPDAKRWRRLIAS